MSLLSLFVLASNAITVAPSDISTSKTEKLHLNTIVNAEPIKRINPKYPMSAARDGKEGWVQLSFVVEPDGSTSRVIVEDSSNKVFEKAALKSIKQWQYSPATLNGEAIQQCRNQVQMDFRLSETSKGASKWFVKKYKLANQYLNKKQFEDAQGVLQEMDEKGLWNGYENLYYNILSTLIDAEKGDMDGELASLQNALRYKDYQKETQYSAFSSRAFSLAIELKQYGDARRIYESFEALYPENAQLKKLSSSYQQIIAYLASEQPIVFDAQIKERDFWRYELERNGFIIDDVQGQLTNLEIRCDNNHSQFLVESGNRWHIPASWGQCAVYVFGDLEASFKFADVHIKDSEV